MREGLEYLCYLLGSKSQSFFGQMIILTYFWVQNTTNNSKECSILWAYFLRRRKIDFPLRKGKGVDGGLENSQGEEVLSVCGTLWDQNYDGLSALKLDKMRNIIGACCEKN